MGVPLITIPLYPIDAQGKCVCGWADSPKHKHKPGKHPACRWRDITESVPIPEGFGGAVLCGQKSGVFVLDIDMKNGKDGLAALAKAKIPLTDTYTVQTPSGGFHLYYKTDAYVPTTHGHVGDRVCEGVDIQGDKGIAYLPGTRTPQGEYTVIDDQEIAECPADLLSLVVGTVVEPVRVAFTEDPESITRALAWLSSEEPLIQGNTDGRMWNIARKLVTGFKLSPETSLQLLEDYNDRGQPPRDWEEWAHKLEDAATKCTTPSLVAPVDFLVGKKEGTSEPAPLRDFDPCNCTAAAKVSKTSFTNLVNILSTNPAWVGVFRHDIFRDRLVAVNPPLIRMDMEQGELSSEDVGGVLCWLEHEGITVGHDMLEKAIRTAAKGNRFHPVRDYLANLPEGDPADLDNLALELFGAEKAIENVFLRKMLIAGVARIYQPGCKHDVILVLYGTQGIRKSSFCRQLFAPWFRDQLPDLANRDASMALLGVWGAEMPELDRMNRVETSTVKEFLSRSVDQYRAFGGKDQIEHPRENLFIGTTNDPEILRDITGNRRFQIIECKKDIAEIQRDAIWAAAKACYLAGENWWLDKEDEKLAETTRKTFEVQDPWKNAVTEWLKRNGTEFVAAADVLSGLFTAGMKDLKSIDHSGMIRVARCLRSLGGTPHKTSNQNLWQMPEDMRKPAVGTPEPAKVAKMSDYR